MPYFYVHVTRDELWKVKADRKEDAEIMFDEIGYLTAEDVEVKVYSDLQDFKNDRG